MERNNSGLVNQTLPTGAMSSMVPPGYMMGYLPPPPPGQHGLINPAMNNTPLEFKNDKNNPFVSSEEPSEQPSRMEPRPEGEQQGSFPPGLNMWGGWLGYPMGGMMGLPQYGMLPEAPPAPREPITCPSCTLFPPDPSAAPPRTQERPPGCKTVFVAGLPENTTEDIIKEIFERCGEIKTIRLNKKRFCHVRFVFEQSVDAALYFSGYRLQLGTSTEPADTGRLYVDYAQAREDLYEWECQQRALQREQRHRERLERERLCPPSPPAVAPYSDHQAQAVAEQIRAEETFAEAVEVVVTWFERGDCNKRNASTFYSLIQSTNAHVRRLLSEKASYEEELERARQLMRGRMQGLLIQFGHIEKVFTAASHKKVWDHFTKAQRRNIEMWRKQTAEIKLLQMEDGLAEMDVSDSETDAPRKRPALDTVATDALKEENDSLRCQLEAYKNEVDLLRGDMKAQADEKERQIKLLQQTAQGMQQQLVEWTRRHAEEEQRVRELQTKLETMGTGGDGPAPATTPETDSKASPPGLVVSSRQARLIGLAAVFLHVHPFGAGVDYLWSYLHKMDSNLAPTEVEALLLQFPAVFRQELSGIGANMERRWQLTIFDSNSAIQ